MPLEARFHEPLEAQWSFAVLGMPSRLVPLRDESYGSVTSWKWDFSGGTTSTDQHP